ncbi:hypothetical protein VTN77DRAFT_4644 [Rasamsonia byssochlamydoides]|uniref:uncharacterized protein n=1 Tax=Rasamsonia byssochlamydoides TaxID=89139 RepID=UPI003742D4E7
MSLFDHSSLASFAAGNVLFSSQAAIRRRQINRLKDYLNGKRFDKKGTRQHRHQLYKASLASHSTKRPDAVKRSLAENPNQYGLPRCWKILTAGEDVILDAKTHDLDRFVDENQTIYFAAFGVANKPIRVNSTWIDPKDITMSPDATIYTINTRNEHGDNFSLYLNFTHPTWHTGHLLIGNNNFVVALQPWSVQFSVSVSANAGAEKSSAKQTLTWDETSDAWKNAAWEKDAMKFSYDTVPVVDIFGTKQMINEVSFVDSKDSTNSFQLTSNEWPTKYTSIMDGSIEKDAVYQYTIVNNPSDVPVPISIRAQDTVTSVYPVEALWKFDTFGTSFTGAYRLPNSNVVYAVKGTGVLPGSGVSAPGKPQTHERPMPLFSSTVQPLKSPFSIPGNKAVRDSPLSVTGLLNLNAMQACDPSISPTGYVDVILQKANEDFHDIICYHMDESIRKTFVSTGPVELTNSVVFQIANDDPGNKAFYQTLSVPYCTTSLSASTLPEAKLCNGERAKKQLKDLPTQSEVYKRHSDALYRHRFNQAYPILQTYMDDQANTDRAADMAHAASMMKANLANQCADTNAHDPDGAQKLADAQADIDALCTWATRNKLFWAFELFYWGQTFYLPNLYAQTSNGTLSTSVSMHLKTLSATIGMLEGGKQNPDGKSFQEAFNDLVRLYQMSSIVPQFVDANNNAEDIDSIQKAMLEQFAQQYANSSDPKLAAEAATAQQLAADDFIRGRFMTILITSMRLSGTLGNWANIANNFVTLLGRTSWYSKLANAAGAMSTLLRSTCVILLILPIINSFGGGWSSMKSGERAGWVTMCVGLGLTFALKAIAGVIRVVALWQDLGGLIQGFKVFMGWSEAVPLVEQYAAECQNSLARWFVRDSEETMAITDASVGLDQMTTGMKVFGRSAGEFLTNSVGAILAVVNLTLSSIDLAKSTDPLQKSLDSMMVLASSFQLLAIGAAWLLAGGYLAEGFLLSCCELMATVCAPMGVVFAVIGLVIMMVMMFQHKDPPNPVQDFVNDQASKAGLTLSNGTAIDYLNIVPDDKQNLSLLGMDFCAMDARNNQVGWLQVQAEKASTPGTYTVGHATAVTFGPDTCWCVQTDAYGVSNIFTYVLSSEGNRRVVCLAELSDGSVGAVGPPSKVTKDRSGKLVPADPEVYQAELARQQWSFACQSAGGTTTRTIEGISVTYQAAATFSITKGGKNLHFERENNVWIPKLGQSDFTWKLTLDSMGPSNFSYIQAPWNLLQTDRDETNAVKFSMPSSTPLNWSITPALPAFLTFRSDGPNEGTISQTPNITPAIMAKTTFTVTASVTLVGKKLSKSTTVAISIIENALVLPSMLSNMPVNEKSCLSTGFHSGTSLLPASRATGGKAGHHPPARAGYVAEAMEAGRDEVGTPNVTDLPFFKWLQPAPMACAEHYTGQVAIALLKNSVTGGWGPGPGMIGDSGTFQALYFPNAPRNPGHNPNDPCDYGSGVNAFIAQAIHNAGSSRCNWDLTQSKIDAFNNRLFDNNFDRFVDWLRSPWSTSVTGPHCSLDEYLSALRDPYWITLRAGEQVDGTWRNQSMEMFQHCLKLAALGASDAQITQAMNTLTVRSSPSSPVLNPSGFPDITSDPLSWKHYRGYLVRSPISYTHLAVQGIGQTFVINPRGRWHLTPNPRGSFGDVEDVEYIVQKDSQFLDASGN